ncbi:hypothetical protein E1301_Tti021306 [Triplophysa tibetana]|uniref:Uncharacterized protein n=1 Tax=Triplophysa tibetana TaxID=1572043 RepID=A0A5A9PA10_9TELE|nr:hypothetical protein E1301_Tti021306 [Triplophysa tibetana]
MAKLKPWISIRFCVGIVTLFFIYVQEIPAEHIDPTSIDLTALVNTLINASQPDFTAVLFDVLGNSTSYLQELFKSNSILSVWHDLPNNSELVLWHKPSTDSHSTPVTTSNTESKTTVPHTRATMTSSPSTAPSVAPSTTATADIVPTTPSVSMPTSALMTTTVTSDLTTNLATTVLTQTKADTVATQPKTLPVQILHPFVTTVTTPAVVPMETVSHTVLLPSQRRTTPTSNLQVSYTEKPGKAQNT